MASSVLMNTAHCQARPPGPTGSDAISAFLHMRQSRLDFIQRMHDRYGKVSRLYLGRRQLVLVSSKSGILRVLQQEACHYKKGLGFSEGRRFFEEGLVTSETDTWKAQRTIMNPFFRGSRLPPWNDQIKEEIAGCLKTIRERSDSPLNLEQCIGDLACNILSRTIMGAPFDSRRTRRALMIIDEYINKKMTSILPALPLSYFQYRNAVRYVKKTALSIVDYNRSATHCSSLISHLLSAGESDTMNVHDQTASFLLAGHDNTASLISWTLLLLASHPEIQQRLRENIAGRWDDAEVSIKLMEEQRYGCAIVFEAMRLFPPVWAIPREALVDTEIDGYFVAQGSQVLLFPYLLHRNPEDWQKPDKFDPSRFLRDTGTSMMTILGRLQKDRMYIPFGFGPRACIGFQHALAVSISVVMALIESFEVRLPIGVPMPPPVPRLSLRPHHNARLQFIPIL